MPRKKSLLSWFYKGKKLIPIRVAGLLGVLLLVALLLLQMQVGGYLKSQSLPKGTGGSGGGSVVRGLDSQDSIFWDLLKYWDDGEFIVGDDLSNVADISLDGAGVKVPKTAPIGLPDGYDDVADISLDGAGVVDRKLASKCARLAGIAGVSIDLLTMQGCVPGNQCSITELKKFVADLELGENESGSDYNQRMCEALLDDSDFCSEFDWCDLQGKKQLDNVVNEEIKEIMDRAEKAKPGCTWVTYDGPAAVGGLSELKIADEYQQKILELTSNACNYSKPSIAPNPSPIDYTDSYPSSPSRIKFILPSATPESSSADCVGDECDLSQYVGARSPRPGFSIWNWLTELVN